jgi:superfamily II DNA or RNA helicase
MDMAQRIEDEFAAVTRIQDRAIGEAHEAMRPGGAILIEAPTGAGKTRIQSRNIANFAADFRERTGRDPYVVVLAHREKLINQGRDELSFWSPECKLSATLSSSVPTPENPKGGLDQSGDVNFCMVQTAAANVDTLRIPDAVFIDEAHHASDADGADYTKVLGHFAARNPDMLLVATTATPGRPDKRGLNPLLKDAAHVTIGYKELERARQINLPRTKQVTIHGEDGRTVNSIMRDHYKPEKDADSSGLAKRILAARPKDYNHQMLAAYDREFADPFDAKGLKAGAVVFETNTKLAGVFHKDAVEHGVKAAIIDSTRTPEENRRAMEDYASGKIDMLVSVKMIDEGVDLPRTRCVIINRGSTSPTEYSQMVGRSVRCGRDPALRETKPVVLDGGASTMIHGSVEQQAAIADYYQRLARGEVREEINEDLRHMRGKDGDYSPWRLSKDPPPVFFLTDGKSNIYAVPQSAPDGRTLYALAEAQTVKGKAEIRIMRDESNKPLINVDAGLLHAIEARRLIPAKYDVLRLEATESRTYPGQNLADERMITGAKEAESALSFAMQMRAASRGR